MCAFRKRAVAAIDLTYIPYYGRPTPYVVQGRYRQVMRFSLKKGGEAVGFKGKTLTAPLSLKRALSAARNTISQTNQRTPSELLTWALSY